MQVKSDGKDEKSVGRKWKEEEEIDSRLLEKVSYDLEDFPLQCREHVLERYAKKEIPWHWHSELEFLYVAKGEITCFVNNFTSVLKEGSGIFINMRESHRFQLSGGIGDIRSILLPAPFIFGKNNGFYKRYIAPIAGSGRYQYILLGQEKQWEKQVVKQMEEIRSCFENKLSEQMPSVVRNICTIWELFYRNREKITVTDPKQVMNPAQSRLQQMISFIQNHYSDPIALADIARAANISQSEAARCFKKYLGTAPVNYLIQYRLEAAKEKLQTSSLSVTDVAIQCGFESVSYFDRVFRKKYWLTPKEFRSNMEQDTSEMDKKTRNGE